MCYGIIKQTGRGLEWVERENAGLSSELERENAGHCFQMYTNPKGILGCIYPYNVLTSGFPRTYAPNLLFIHQMTPLESC